MSHYAVVLTVHKKHEIGFVSYINDMAGEQDRFASFSGVVDSAMLARLLLKQYDKEIVVTQGHEVEGGGRLVTVEALCEQLGRPCGAETLGTIFTKVHPESIHRCPGCKR